MGTWEYSRAASPSGLGFAVCTEALLKGRLVLLVVVLGRDVKLQRRPLRSSAEGLRGVRAAASE